MNTQPYDAIIVHGNKLSKDGQLSKDAIERVRTAVLTYEEGLASQIVFTGGKSFTQRDDSVPIEAYAMQNYALLAGVNNSDIYTEVRSLETIGNVLFTKSEIVTPNKWSRLAVVTSESHLKRTLGIYHHIYDSSYDIIGIPSPNNATALDKIKEFIGSLVVNAIFNNVENTSDSDEIKEKLFATVPGYIDSTTPINLALAITKELVTLKKPQII